MLASTWLSSIDPRHGVVYLGVSVFLPTVHLLRIYAVRSCELLSGHPTCIRHMGG